MDASIRSVIEYQRFFAKTKHTPKSELSWRFPHGKTEQLGGIKLILFGHRIESVKANLSRMAAGQSAATSRGACLLRRFLARTAGPSAARDCRRGFSRRSSRRLEQTHVADELLSRSKCGTDCTKDCRDGVATGKKHNRHNHRDCAGTLRRKRRLRSAPGCLEHNLGRKSHARSRSFEFSTEPLSFICNGWRHLFSAACIAGDRSPA